MKNRLKIAAVLLAGGEGKRFNNKIPKQYIKINNKPILFYTLEKLINCGVFSEIAVVVNKNWIKKLSKIVDKILETNNYRRVKYIVGGQSRSQSSYNAIKFLENKKVDYVLFHDAVRPFITEGLIKKVIKTALRSGAAVTGIKSLESTALVKNNRISNVFPLRSAFFIQTPECFRFGLIQKAYDKFHKNQRFFSKATNLHLMFALKKKISVVRYNERNLKLTFPSDLKIAQASLN